MYRLLVVDDEPIIVEGLADLFGELSSELDIDVYRAYSAGEALDWLRRVKIDILLTDIRMPEMSGLALQQEIIQYWPHCRVIFLTGYDDFSYVQAAIRHGGADYVLKTEDDEQIVRSVRKALDGLALQFERERLIDGAEEKLQIALPSLRKAYLLDLLQGGTTTIDSRRTKFAELGIDLQPGAPVWMAIGRVDRWYDDIRPEEKPLMLFAIRNIAETFFARKLSMVHVDIRSDRSVWLIQPGEEASGRLRNDKEVLLHIQGCLEAVQLQSQGLLRLPCSFVIAGGPAHWERLEEKLASLQWKLNLGLGMGREMLLTETAGKGHAAEQPQMHLYLRKLRQLETFLDSGQRDSFQALLLELAAEAPALTSQKHEVIYEIYYSCAVMFLSCLNRWNATAELSVKFDMGRLVKMEEHASWEDITSFFLQLADLFFDYREKEFLDRTQEMALQISDYVHSHLDGDLSQAKLAEIVYLSPAYLSRLFKQTMGVSLTDFIMDARMARAKQPLVEGRLKIHEIAHAVGYESASYFTRFFKKMTHLTPQEYKEQAGG